MATPELAQLEMLAQVDELMEQLTIWTTRDTHWEPMRRCQALLKRLLARTEQLRIRLESPLVVATFGGTGTGKSTLVNALVGQECSKTGRQRPTTMRPVAIAHPQTELEIIGLPVEQLEVARVDSPMLRDIVIIDCPDPDTSETSDANSNLERLRTLLPHCDVLIYTSTQQKYRSARVLDELQQAAEGCRLIFVQTHADIDSDIREDWRDNLADEYEVPDVFLVDSLRALKEQQQGQRPTGDFARLQDLLTTQLAASQRVKIRRSNLIDLIHSALEYCREQLQGQQQPLEELEAALEEQRQKLTAAMTNQLQQELQHSQNLWERRLLTSVTQHWGVSPFSSVLRFYNSLGSVLASFTFFRARNSAQLALLGAMQGARWLTGQQREQDAEERVKRIGSFGLQDASLKESQIVITGYVKSAKLDSELAGRNSLETLRDQAVNVEDEFLGDASQKVDTIIDDLAKKNTGWFTRFRYELLFGAYILFVLYRVGKNFFYDSFLKDIIHGKEEIAANTVNVTHMLPMEFYIAAIVFFLLWTGFLVILFTQRLRKGLKKRIDALAEELANYRVSQGLFPKLETACEDVQSDCQKLDSLAESTRELRSNIATSEALGAQLSPYYVEGSVK